MQDGLVITDLEGNIIYVNSIVARITGVPSQKLNGLNFVNLLTEEQAAEFDAALQTELTKGYLSLELDYHAPNGRIHYISTNSALVHNQQGQPQQIVVNMRDITQQRKHENRLLNLNRLTTNLVHINDIQNLTENILQISEELLNADASLITIMDPDSGQITNKVPHNFPLDYGRLLTDSERLLPENTAIKTLNPVGVSDTRNETAYGDIFQILTDENLGSLLTLPISLEEKAIGVLSVAYVSTQEFDENTFRLGMTLAQTLAIIIQNARLYTRSKRRADEMAALVTAAATVSTSLDYHEILRIVSEQMTRLLGIKTCVISEFDPQGNTLAMLAAHHPKSWNISEQWPIPYDVNKLPLALKTLETNKPI
jgi:PAS domain S-box-containing protein